MRLPQVHRSSLPRAGLFALLCLALAQAGCVYRMAIQQGNYLEPRAVEKLEIGMTRSQVRYLLGTPMVPGIFDADRWDYLYYLKRAERKPVQRKLTVYFQADKVARVEKDGPVTAPKPEEMPPALRTPS